MLKFIFVLILLFPVVANAEVFMYQDSSGQWHGVSSKNQVPAEYQNQLNSVIDNEPTPTPSRIKAQKVKEKREARQEKSREAVLQKIEAKEKKDIDNQKKKMRNDAIEIFKQFAQTLIGTTIYTSVLNGAGQMRLELVDYKIISQKVDVNYSDFSMERWAGNAYFKVKWDCSDTSSTGSYVTEYVSHLDEGAWTPFQNLKAY